jgi:hypothetical protein
MTTRLTPRDAATAMEHAPVLPGGADERVAGYGVIGLPFASGHYLAMRDFLASSIGPAYRSVWHRDPAGAWTVYSTTPPEQGCPRYIGSALVNPSVTTPIDVTWLGESELRVYIDDVLDWTMLLRSTAATRLMSAVGERLPDSAWTNRFALAALGRVAGPLLSAGRMRLTGDMPNGQEFRAAPRQVWVIESSDAALRGEDLGALGPLPSQDRLGDFWLPQRGIFFADGAGRFTDSGHSVGAAGAR